MWSRVRCDWDYGRCAHTPKYWQEGSLGLVEDRCVRIINGALGFSLQTVCIYIHKHMYHADFTSPAGKHNHKLGPVFLGPSTY